MSASLAHVSGVSGKETHATTINPTHLTVDDLGTFTTEECPTCTEGGYIIADDCTTCGASRWVVRLESGRLVSPAQLA